MNSEVRVLHVDDEPVICDLTKLTLERGGKLKVDVVHRAQEALELVHSGVYSCIISDYEMPEMNGLDFLKEVRNIDKNIPFILFSGRGREAVIIDAINTGADFYIQKGGEPKALFAELNHKVEYAIQQRNTRLALKRRDAVLEVVSLVSNLFLGGEPFSRAIQEAINLFGLATEVDAVRLFRFDNEKGNQEYEPCIRNIASWTRISIHSPEREEYIQKGCIPVNPDLILPLLKGQPFILDASNISHLDPCKGELSARSVVLFPVFVNQEVWGLIWFADYISTRNWSGVEIDALLAASSMVGSAIQQDIMKSSLIEAKEEYAEMYSLMRRLCDTVPDILWAKDEKGKFLFINQAGADFLNAYDTIDPVGKSENDFSKREFRLHSSSHLSDPQDRGLVTVQNQAGISDYEFMNVPFKNSEGENIGTVTLGRNITRYTSIENLLRKSHERYESIIQSVHLGIILADSSGIVKKLNNRALELINATKDSIEEQFLNRNEILRHMDIDTLIHKVLESGKTLSFFASREKYDIPEDLHCMIKRIVAENGVHEVLITLDPHYSL